MYPISELVSDESITNVAIWLQNNASHSDDK